MKKILSLAVLLLAASVFFACGDSKADNGTSPSISIPPGDRPADRPTEAFKRLYAAVKSKNTEAIKSEVSSKTQAMALFVSRQQNAPIEKVYENGFTGTTFSPALPEIRDERIKDNMGAIEVWNSRDSRYEDVPFVLEDNVWKLAVGDIFSGSFVSPGQSRTTKENVAANAMNANRGINRIELPSNVNANFRGGNRSLANKNK